MPVMKVSNGKWRIGEHGKAMYDTKEEALKAYGAYLAKQSRLAKSNQQ